MSIIKQTYFDQHGTVAGNAAKTAQWYTCPNCAKQSPLTLEWVGLTDKEILADDVLRYHFGLNGGAGPVSKSGRKIVDAIEAKLKERT